MDELRLPFGKYCTKCGDWKLWEEFGKKSSSRSGRNSWCKACICAAARRYKQENPEKVAETMRNYDKRNRGKRAEAACLRRRQNPQKNYEIVRRSFEKNREKNLELKRKRYREDREKNLEYRRKHYKEIRERRRKYYQLNKERHRERVRQWFKDNPGQAYLYTKRRRAKKLGAEGSHTTEEWLALCEFYGNLCLCCGKSKRLTADHVIPLSKGGPDDISNIQPLCRSCNSRKSTNSTDYRPI